MNEQAIFVAALQEEREHRAAYLDRACGTDAALRQRVEVLLDAHERAGSFLRQPAAAGLTDAYRPISEGPGTVIGPYKLLQQIGEGGFGVVYMAEQQEPVRRKVAFKIIKPGMDSREVIARFESERQALALMDHPNVAHVFDAGSTASGRPYFVMELVRGVPITEFCDKNHLPARERLELFGAVCHAVQHAHQKGIIHRDIKPTNILVTLHDGKPVPKVIDFGVAKATSQQLTQRTLFTAYGQMVGTPAYMSPEQAEMSGLDIDTRSDIYSLGVLLYELLTGTTPLESQRLREAGYAEMQRLIREEEPPRPSTRLTSLGGAATVLAGNRGTDVKRLAQMLRGDLDWIVMKALEKDRNRRYETPTAFAADVDRFLREEAILARPPSALYRLRKLARRNRATVLTAAALLILLLAGIAGTSLGLVWAVRAEHEARHDASRARDAEESVARERDGAVQARAEVERVAAQGESRRLTLESLAVRPTNPGLALLLAVAGAERWPARYAPHNNALLGALLECREERTFFAPPLPARSGRTGRPAFLGLQVTADGRRAVAVSGPLSRPNLDLEFHRHITWSVSVYDLQTGQVTATLGIPGAWIGTMCISPDGRLLAAAPCYGVLRRTTDGHAVVYTNRAVRLWDLQTGKEIRVLTGHTDRVVSLQFDARGERLLSASWDGTARIWDVASGKMLHVLSDGKLSLELAQFSPDGRRVLTAGTGGTIRSNVSDAEFPRLFQLQPDKVAMDPPVQEDGTLDLIQLLASTSMVSDGSFAPSRLWDAGTGQLVAALAPATDAGLSEHTAVGFSPDSARAVTMGRNGLSLWNAEDGKHVADGELSVKSPVHFLHDGDRHLRVVRSAGPRIGIDADEGPGLIVWQSDNNQQRWQRSPGASPRIREDSEYRERQPFPLASSVESAPLITWSSGDAVTIRPTGDGNDLAVLRGHDDNVTAAAFLSDGRRVVTASLDGTLRLWNLEASPGPVVELRQAVGPPVGHAFFLGRGRQVITETAGDPSSRFAGRLLVLWDTATGARVTDLCPDAARATSPLHKKLLGDLQDVDVSPDGTRLVTVHRDCNPCANYEEAPQPSPLYTPVRVWDLPSGKLRFVLGGLRQSVARARFSPDGRRLLTMADGSSHRAAVRAGHITGTHGSSGGGKPVRADVWDGETGKHVRNLVPERPGSGFFALWSPDGRRVLTDATLRAVGEAADLLDAETGERLATLKSAGGMVDSAAFSPDGQLVLGYRRQIITDQALVEVWDAATGAKRADLRGHRGEVTAAEFSPDNRLILTASADGTARLWDVATGEERRRVRGHRHEVRGGRFSPDGQWFATASTDGTARIWSTETGQEWMTLPAPQGVGFLSVAFSPDNQRLLTGLSDGTARIWPVDPLPLAASRKPRELTADERARFQMEEAR
jgi:WD40 repeat protein/serine/threonine protein kinase